MIWDGGEGVSCHQTWDSGLPSIHTGKKLYGGDRPQGLGVDESDEAR